MTNRLEPLFYNGTGRQQGIPKGVDETHHSILSDFFDKGNQHDFFYSRYSLLSFRGPQLYNLEALPFIYGQYVPIKLADKLYNSVTIHFCAS